MLEIEESTKKRHAFYKNKGGQIHELFEVALPVVMPKVKSPKQWNAALLNHLLSKVL